jgi:hypothetical protein
MQKAIKATKNIRVFVDKRLYGNTKIEHTDVGKIPEHKREDLSWKGCYYTIEPDEIFYFDRDNRWDACFFKLSNGAEFKIDVCDYKAWANRNEAVIC